MAAGDLGLSKEEREQKEADGTLGERREIDNYDPYKASVGDQPDYHANENGYVGTDPMYQNHTDDDTHKPYGVVAPYETNAPEGVLTGFEEYHGVEVVEREDNVVSPKDQEKAARRSEHRGVGGESKPRRPAAGSEEK